MEMVVKINVSGGDTPYLELAVKFIRSRHLWIAIPQWFSKVIIKDYLDVSASALTVIVIYYSLIYMVGRLGDIEL